MKMDISIKKVFKININAPIVQWIEFQIPVLKMGVRIPLGAQKNYRFE